MHKIIIATLFVGYSLTAQAAGFLLNEFGASATGRGDAVTASVTNPSAIFYNPAGIAKTKGYQIYLGGSLIQPNGAYIEKGSGTKTETTTGLAVTPNFFLAANVYDFVSLGVGFFTPFGLTIEWPEDSAGRTILLEQSLRTFFFSPVVGLDLSQWVPGLSIGGGVDVVPSAVELKRAVEFGTDAGKAHLGGNGLGLGGRVGLMYNPHFLPGLHIGVSYRSAVNLDLEGDADFDIDSAYRAQLPPDGKLTTTIDLPQMILAGIAYRVLPELEIAFDINWIDWSTFTQLDLRFANDTNSVIAKNYEDTLVIRVGVEYSITDLGLDIRAGYVYDPTPIPASHLDVSLPDHDRHDICFGLGYKVTDNFYVDLGLLYVLPGELDAAEEPFQPLLKGSYEMDALVVSLNLGFSFGAESAPAAVVFETQPAPSE